VKESLFLYSAFSECLCRDREDIVIRSFNWKYFGRYRIDTRIYNKYVISNYFGRDRIDTDIKIFNSQYFGRDKIDIDIKSLIHNILVETG
jgi:hypothetical protein